MLEKNGTWRSRSFPDQMLLPTQLHFKDGQKVEKFNAAALPFIHALSTTPHLFEAYKGYAVLPVAYADLTRGYIASTSRTQRISFSTRASWRAGSKLRAARPVACTS